MKFLHTMLRVGDMQRSVDFYTRIIGMQVLRTTDMPEQKYSLTFLGFGTGNADGGAELELTYNYGVASYELGHGLRAPGHRRAGCGRHLRAASRRRAARWSARPGPVKGGTTVIAFVEDPDGYKIELIERL